MRDRIYFIILLTILGFCNLRAQSAETVRKYIEEHKATALQFEKEYGIPAPITLAQAILESGAGTSSLTRNCNNHFCIKAGKSWNGPIYLAWDDETSKSRFRQYASADDSFRDYARLLSTSKYYKSLFDINIYDYRGWAHGLKKAGYATSPTYAEALIGIIDLYQLYTINGGVKLRPGKTVTITRYIETTPIFDPECQTDVDEISEEENTLEKVRRRYLVTVNDVHCTLLQPGETLSSIARRYNIPMKQLLDYNELATERNLHEGDIVYLDKKKKKYDGPHDYYDAQEGETIYNISQNFGIRVKSLARLNQRDPYARLCSGERIYLK